MPHESYGNKLVPSDATVLKSPTPEQIDFLRAHFLCRLATADEKGAPHVTPVIYAMDGSKMVIAIDYGTKKLSDLRKNPRAAAVVDEYKPNKGVTVRGLCIIHETGKEYRRLLGILMDRFESYRRNPWGEGDAPIIVFEPHSWASWGV